MWKVSDFSTLHIIVIIKIMIMIIIIIIIIIIIMMMMGPVIMLYYGLRLKEIL